LAVGFCIGITEGREINNDFNMPEIKYRVNETENITEKAEKNQNEITGVFHTQNVFFTENNRRFVVVYPNSSRVSLTRNENAANRSKEEVCLFL
jgi:adenylate cyclase class IV